MSRKKLIKIAISAAMLLFVLHFVDGKKLAASITQVPTWLIASVVTAYSLGQMISAYKWRLLLRSAGVTVSFTRTLTAYFIGMYVNCFGLGTLGGDIVRGLLVAEGNHQRHISLASVIADRALGLGVLVAIGLGAALIFGHDHIQVQFIYLGIGFLILVAAVWIFSPQTIKLLLVRHPHLHEKVGEMLAAFPKNPVQLGWICFISFVFHLTQIALHALIASGLGSPIPWSYLLVAVPFANIISTLPISWMGLGVRENLYVLFFVPMFLTQESAVVFGALWLFGMTMAAAIGGISAVITGDIKILSDKSSLKMHNQQESA